jgi:hypothetical protein
MRHPVSDTDVHGDGDCDLYINGDRYINCNRVTDRYVYTHNAGCLVRSDG